jgi:glycerophosphoryl diester phosphodiesterase
MAPLLLGHRGARVASIPENTFAAFDFALASGCAGFEFDVRTTVDAHAIVCHDPKIHGRIVSRTKYSELVGRYRGTHGAVGSAGTDVRTGPPALQDVLARYGQQAFLDIELKVDGLEQRVAEMLDAHPPNAFVVSSFLPSILRSLGGLASQIPLGLIADSVRALALWPELPVQFIMPHQKLVSAEFLKRARDAGKKVIVWTVNEPQAIRRFTQAGADGLISDFPELLVRTVENGPLA